MWHRKKSPAFLLVFALLTCSCLAHPSLNASIDARLRPVSRSDKCPIKFDEDPPETSLQGASRQRDQTLSSRQVDPFIVGGDFAARELVNSVVAIYAGGPDPEQYSCTGTLVSSRWVVTAAHCAVSESSRVLFGGRRIIDANEGNLFAVSRVITHPSYDPDTERSLDIAIFELAEGAPADSKFMKINVNPSLPKPDSYVRVVGFGRTSENGEDSSRQGVLRQVDVPTNSNEDCSSSYPDVNLNAQVCAGYYEEGGCAACDGGGPMIQYNDEGQPVLVGIMSRGSGCARAKFPTVYTRTAAFKDWMDQQSDFVFTSTESTKAVFDSSFSTGAIVGIAISSVVAVVLIIALIVVIIRRRRPSPKPSVPTAPVGGPQRPGIAAGSGDNKTSPPKPTNFVPAPEPQPDRWDGGSGPSTPQWAAGARPMSYPGSHGSGTPPSSLQFGGGPAGYAGAQVPPPRPPPQVPYGQQQQYYAGHGYPSSQEGSYGQMNVGGFGAATAPPPTPQNEPAVHGEDNGPAFRF